MMPFLISCLIYCFLQLSAFGQVPLPENFSQPLPSDSATIENNDFFPSGVLSDPEELSLIEGLDEPMERLRLRDQDTNMILDMIQVITGRYILRPQNLPAVKITFDSFHFR